MPSPYIELRLPSWLDQFIAEYDQPTDSAEARMQLAIKIAKLNIENRTGGPFGAAIFDMESHQLVSTGVNLVTSSNCSMAHAEMVAMGIAQKKLGTYDLGAATLPRLELVTSCEPCAMCFGALPWSGIRHLACGARDEDARAIGFDEGPKVSKWIEELNERSVSVETDICRDEAKAVLNLYATMEGEIYNARQN